MPPSQVAGFNDYDPKYKCCCYVRTCSIIIGFLWAICGGLGLTGSLWRMLGGHPLKGEVIGGIGLLLMFLAGCILLVGIFKEKSQLLFYVLVITVLITLLGFVQSGITIALVVNKFDKNTIRGLKMEKYCTTYGFRCDENSKYYMIVMALLGLFIYVLLMGFFFNRIYRARQYLIEKDAARGAGYQMGFVQHQ